MQEIRKVLLATLTIAMVATLALPGVVLAKSSGPTGVHAQSVITFEDAYESDNTTATAKFAPEVSFRTFHTVDDIDMCKITATKGQLFTIETELYAANNDYDDVDYGDFDTEIVIWDSAGNTVAQDDDHDYFYTYSSSMVFEAPEAGTYYIDVHELDADDRGAFWLYVNEGIGHRISGADRYGTSAAISHRINDNANIFGNANGEYGDGVYEAVVASGEDFADAVTGSILANAYDAPLFITAKGHFPDSVADELDRLFGGPSMYYGGEQPTVFILGGENAVAPNARREIGMVETVGALEEVSGADRYETAVEIAYAVWDERDIDSVYVVSGSAWADAIAVASIAPSNNGVILLSTTAMVPQTTLDAIDDIEPAEVIVVGGTSAVSAAAMDQLRSVAATDTVSRIAGANRYETARLVAEHGVDDLGMSADCTLLASGESYPDALSASPLSWWLDTPLLLTRPDVLSPDVTMFLKGYGPIPSLESGEGDAREGDVSYLVGGPAAVSDSVYHQWRTTFFETIP